MAAEFGWWPMSPWLSPGAVWFVFFNVIVGAIAVMSSRGAHESGTRTRRKLLRTSSTVVLDSLRSISIFSFHSVADYSAAPAPAPLLHHVQDRYHTFQQQEPHEAASVAQEESVVLPRTAPVASSESQVVEHGDSSISISLDEAYALARASRQSPTAAAAAAADTVASVLEEKRELPVVAGEVKARAYGCGRGTDQEVEGKAEVNARAERFIRQFREELKLERINSILNYRPRAAPPR